MKIVSIEILPIELLKSINYMLPIKDKCSFYIFAKLILNKQIISDQEKEFIQLYKHHGRLSSITAKYHHVTYNLVKYIYLNDQDYFFNDIEGIDIYGFEEDLIYFLRKVTNLDDGYYLTSVFQFTMLEGCHLIKPFSKIQYSDYSEIINFGNIESIKFVHLYNLFKVDPRIVKLIFHNDDYSFWLNEAKLNFKIDLSKLLSILYNDTKYNINKTRFKNIILYLIENHNSLKNVQY